MFNEHLEDENNYVSLKNILPFIKNKKRFFHTQHKRYFSFSKILFEKRINLLDLSNTTLSGVYRVDHIYDVVKKLFHPSLLIDKKFILHKLGVLSNVFLSNDSYNTGMYNLVFSFTTNNGKSLKDKSLLISTNCKGVLWNHKDTKIYFYVIAVPVTEEYNLNLRVLDDKSINKCPLLYHIFSQSINNGFVKIVNASSLEELYSKDSISNLDKKILSETGVFCFEEHVSNTFGKIVPQEEILFFIKIYILL